KYISVDRLIEQPTMDPEYVPVGDFVAAAREGRSFEADRITPPILAEMPERDNREALRLVEGIAVSNSAPRRYEVADARSWAQLGLHLAAKVRGAVALQTYRVGGDEEDRRRAIAHLEEALAHWDEVIQITRPLYRDMRLTHYNHNFFDANEDNLFHWARIRDEVANDVEIARGIRE